MARAEVTRREWIQLVGGFLSDVAGFSLLVSTGLALLGLCLLALGSVTVVGTGVQLKRNLKRSH